MRKYWAIVILVSILLGSCSNDTGTLFSQMDADKTGFNFRNLVVDDESAIRLFITIILGDIGYSVHEASDGLMAIDIFSRMPEKFDVVILDLSMPNMNGRECLRKLLEIRPDVKVLISTGHDTSMLKHELTNMGALGILQKPFEVEELLIHLDKVISL